MSEPPLSPLSPIDTMPDLTAGVNTLHENSSDAQQFITNNSRDVNESPTMHSEDSISTTPRSPRPPLSSSDSDGDDINRPFVDGGDGSPPPNCAICLSRCKNKCFIESCNHQFCFKCLCKWSKVKPECPLCKQTFKYIIHNVESMDQFEEHHVQAPTIDIPDPSSDLVSFGVLNYPNRAVIVPPHLDFPRNRNSLVLTSDPSSSSSRSVANSANPFDAARVTRVYPMALLDYYYRQHPDSIGDEDLSHTWRTYIYYHQLYAMPVSDITGRFRECSARFYRENPAELHRLMPWIQRDIDCLIDGVSMQRHDLVRSIGEILLLMNIISAAFRLTIQPYLGTRTAHFIHELLNFARSPYDMIDYDRTVRYSPRNTEDNTNIGRRSHPTVAATSTSTSTVTSEAQAVVNAINLTIHDRMNITPHITNIVRQADTNSGTDEIIELDDESDNNNDPAAWTSRQEILEPFQGTNNEQFSESSAIPVTDNIEPSSDSSEYVFVLPLWHTPEIISLDSGSDSDVVFVNEVKSAGADHYEEIYNVGASTSAGLRSTTSTRSKRNSLKQNKTFRPLRRNKSRRKFSLRASSTVSTTSSSSFSSVISISTTDLSSPSSSSSQQKQHNVTSTNDTESNNSSNRVMKNDSLGMAVKDTLKKEKNRGQMETQKEKWETNKKGRSCRKRQRPVSIEYTDDENACRNDAVNEPLKKRQRRQARNSYKMTQQQDQETQNDIVNDKSPKLSVSTNVFENSTPSTSKNNEQSTSRFSKRRNTLEHNYPRKLEEQQRKQRRQQQQQQQQQSHLSKNASKHEYFSNDDDDNADDDDSDHLN